MEAQTRKYCLSAVAYLKVELTDDQEPDLTLSDSESPVLRSLGDDLLAAYLVDEGEAFSYVQHGHLAESRLDPDELHAQAVANLSALAERHVVVQRYGNIYAVLMGGNFEASVILLDQFWSEWYAHLVPNGFVAAFPARDLLAFGDASSPAALRELDLFCERSNGHVDHPLSASLFRRVGSGWVFLRG